MPPASRSRARIEAGTEGGPSWCCPSRPDQAAQSSCRHKRERGIGAGDGIRTRDIQLGRLALYRLSYSRSEELAARRRCVRWRWQFPHTISHLATSAMVRAVPARPIMRLTVYRLTEDLGDRSPSRKPGTGPGSQHKVWLWPTEEPWPGGASGGACAQVRLRAPRSGSAMTMGCDSCGCGMTSMGMSKTASRRSARRTWAGGPASTTRASAMSTTRSA